MLIYLKINDPNLQSYFAVLSFIEKYHDRHTFQVDNDNKKLLLEALKYFKFRTLEGKPEESKIIPIITDHESPKTEIVGHTIAPLIFPRLISQKFFSSAGTKKNKVYFKGLLTKKRRLEFLWLCIKLKDWRGFAKVVLSVIPHPKFAIIKTSKLFICESKRGRNENYKYLDEQYYKEMSNYKYVYCPKGDFVWTYRFLEAIQVGSIPIITFSSMIYSGFTCFRFPKKYSNKEFDAVIQRNLQVFRKNFCLSKLE